MKKTIQNMLITLVLGLTACSARVDVPPVSVASLGDLSKIRGKHAAMIQKGGWHLETKARGFQCGAWSFDTSVDESFTGAMREALSQTLDNVAFIESELSKEDLKNGGYSDQIIVYQGNASSVFGVNPGFFIGTGVGEVELTTNIAITDASGLAKQYTATGKSSGSADAFMCSDIEKAVGIAAQGAVKDVAEKSVMLVREGLRDRLDKATHKSAEAKEKLKK